MSFTVTPHDLIQWLALAKGTVHPHLAKWRIKGEPFRNGHESNDLKVSTVQTPGPQDDAVNREAVNHSAKLQLKKVALKRESKIAIGKWTPPNGENHWIDRYEAYP